MHKPSLRNDQNSRGGSYEDTELGLSFVYYRAPARHCGSRLGLYCDSVQRKVKWLKCARKLAGPFSGSMFFPGVSAEERKAGGSHTKRLSLVLSECTNLRGPFGRDSWREVLSGPG